jgi:cytochrome c
MKSLGYMIATSLAIVGCRASDAIDRAPQTGDDSPTANGDPLFVAAQKTLEEGRHTFRFDTFGDEKFWGDTLKLHEAILGSVNGGVGPGLSPKQALALGLKVDVDALPADVVNALKNGKVNLDDPMVTMQLLKANAVVGVTGFFHGNKASCDSIGIQCALCHSTVDDSLAPGIGHRRDGWPNRDLDVGSIIAFAPDLSVPAKLLGVTQEALRGVLHTWGPGKFDASVFLDGKAFQPDGRSAAELIPAAFGLAGVALHTVEGWGSVPYWNAFVAVLEMHGTGNFFDPRLDDAKRFPIAAANGFGHITLESEDDDRVTPKLPALHVYQLALPVPTPPDGSFDADLAEEGDKLFEGKGKCASCHHQDRSEAGWPMHTAAEIGIDDFQASRGPDDRYRTTPLKGLFTHMKGGFYHDGRFATLLDVVTHYDQTMKLGLTDHEKAAIVEYLKSI